MEGFSFEQYQNTDYPCFLLSKSFSVIKANNAAMRPVLNNLHCDGAFQEIFNKNPDAYQSLLNNNISFFNLNENLQMEKRLGIFGVNEGYLAVIGPKHPPLSEPWFTAELRERVSAIFSTLPLLDKKLEADTEAEKCIETISRSCYNLLRTAQNMSTLSNIHAVSKRTSPICLNQTLADIVDCTNKLCLGLNIPINLVCKSENVIIDFNIELFEICVTNILLNSMQYTQDDNEITIYINKIADNAVITFADHGKGIKEDAIEQIFATCYSTDPYMDGETRPGLGLGLPVVYQAVSEMNGKCSLESRFGEGCRLTISLPLSKASPETINSVALNYYTNRFSTPFIQLSPICSIPRV